MVRDDYVQWFLGHVYDRVSCQCQMYHQISLRLRILLSMNSSNLIQSKFTKLAALWSHRRNRKIKRHWENVLRVGASNQRQRSLRATGSIWIGVRLSVTVGRVKIKKKKKRWRARSICALISFRIKFAIFFCSRTFFDSNNTNAQFQFRSVNSWTRSLEVHDVTHE